MKSTKREVVFLVGSLTTGFRRNANSLARERISESVTARSDGCEACRRDGFGASDSVLNSGAASEEVCRACRDQRHSLARLHGRHQALHADVFTGDSGSRSMLAQPVSNDRSSSQ